MVGRISDVLRTVIVTDDKAYPFALGTKFGYLGGKLQCRGSCIEVNMSDSELGCQEVGDGLT